MNTRQKTKGGHCALLRVWSDVLMAADTRQVTLLCLLYLSADFVASATTYCRHQGRRTGMDLLVPERSYTANCIWRLVVDAVSTAVWRPQGSVLGPLLTDCTQSTLLTLLMSLNDTAYVYTSMQMTVRYT